jgi:hypothetical protein
MASNLSLRLSFAETLRSAESAFLVINARSLMAPMSSTRDHISLRTIRLSFASATIKISIAHMVRGANSSILWKKQPPFLLNKQKEALNKSTIQLSWSLRLLSKSTTPNQSARDYRSLRRSHFRRLARREGKRAKRPSLRVLRPSNDFLKSAEIFDHFNFTL